MSTEMRLSLTRDRRNEWLGLARVEQTLYFFEDDSLKSAVKVLCAIVSFIGLS